MYVFMYVKAKSNFTGSRKCFESRKSRFWIVIGRIGKTGEYFLHTFGPFVNYVMLFLTSVTVPQISESPKVLHTLELKILIIARFTVHL